MFTTRLQRATAHITEGNGNLRSTLVIADKPAHPRNYTDLPTIITAICVMLWTLIMEEGRGNQNSLASLKVEYSAFKPAKPVLFYGILGLYSRAYYISVFKSILKIFFPHGNSLLRFSFFKYCLWHKHWDWK